MHRGEVEQGGRKIFLSFKRRKGIINYFDPLVNDMKPVI